MESKCAFLISLLQTSLYEITSAILSIEESTMKVIQLCSYLQDLPIPTSNHVDLEIQSNFKCLIGLNAETRRRHNIPLHVYGKFVKQHTED